MVIGNRPVSEAEEESRSAVLMELLAVAMTRRKAPYALGDRYRLATSAGCSSL